MTEGIDFEVETAADATEQRDAVVREVTSHAGQIARELALLQGGDYGQRTFATKRGEWTLKYEAGAIQYLRFSPKGGGDTYVVSTKQPPEPEALAEALEDYEAFVAAYNDHIDSLAGVFDDVELDPPAVASTEAVVAERDRILETVWDVCNAIAGQLHRYEGTDYGTFATRVAGTRWELKWEGDVASYLRVGGEGGVYLLSQYGPPSAPDVRELAPDVPAFVAAYNDHVEELGGSLERVSLADAAE
ncbi:hypothetical protein ACNS7O_04605 [Haloferacaceae archaeon DSL9]